MRYRWIEEPVPLEPALNMQRDEAMLAEMIDGRGLPAVRIYRWSRPAVTIGRLQHEADARAVYPDLPIVRRPTGGRAVLHGDDLTISVATRTEWLSGTGRSVLSTYRLIAAPIVEALRRGGIDAELGRTRVSAKPAADWLPASKRRTRSGEGVDCFASLASCDIGDSTGLKLVGCAQRRVQEAILQQMSIPGAVLLRLSDLETFVGAMRECMFVAFDVEAWV